MLKINENELKNNKKDFLIIEGYDYDGGYYSYNYLVINEKVNLYKKDLILVDLVKNEYDRDNSFSIEFIIDKVFKNKIDELNKSDVDCLHAYHVFLISSNFKLKRHIEVNCIPDNSYN